MECNARFLFACNDLPVFKDKSIGLEDRIVFIPFDLYIKEEDRDTKLVDKLIQELPGILNWALAGAKTMVKERMIPKYVTTAKSKENYKMETDPLYSWFKTSVEVVAITEKEITVTDAYNSYTLATEKNGNKAFSKDKFSKRFRKLLSDECQSKNIYYEPELRDRIGGVRVFNVFNLKPTSEALTGDT